jgi:hypothetical protein
VAKPEPLVLDIPHTAANPGLEPTTRKLIEHADLLNQAHRVIERQAQYH